MAVWSSSRIISGVKVEWGAGVTRHVNDMLKDRQKVIDSEVIRLCSRYVPFRTGTLERSGTVGTVIGSGEVKYTVPYAREQYFKTRTSRSYDAKRGGKWFERMKAEHHREIESLVNRK